MKQKNIAGWGWPTLGVLVYATSVSAAPGVTPYLHTTNRVTVSLRYGLNISGGFKGTGSTFAPNAPLKATRFTPHGDKYNYDDGYALPDISGSQDGYSWYWGYDAANQVDATAANTIDLHRTDATGMPGKNSGDDDGPNLGLEVAWNYELGRDEWRQIYYGVEMAVNWMPVDFSQDSIFGVTLTPVTDTYGYTPGTTPPSAALPYQGSYGQAGFVINYPRQNSVAGQSAAASFIVQQDFDANIWGFRLGPYLEYLPSEKWSLHLGGGLALGLIDANASWRETLSVTGGDTTSLSGGGDDLSLLAGFYIGVSAQYKFNERWSVEAGVQYQDIGTYDHNFGGRSVELDLSSSVFIHAGISYSF